MQSLHLRSRQKNIMEDLENKFTIWLRRLGYAESSVRSRGRQLRHFLVWLGEKKVDEVDQETVEKYAKHLHEKTSDKTGRGLSTRTIEAYLSVLILLDKYRRKHGKTALLRARPQVHGKVESKARRIASRAEVTKLYAAIPTDQKGPYLRCLLALFYGCGLRCGEGIRLKIREVDLAGGLLLVSRAKNHHQRYVPLSEGVKNDLRGWLEGGRIRYAYPNCDNVLLNRRGGPANNSGLNKQLAELCALAGVEKVSLHGLRHSIATHLLADGMGLAAIGRFLGHRSLQATQTYTHLVDEL
jgi:site-specific recombinase XerD